jgi:hypothetical protein
MGFWKKLEHEYGCPTNRPVIQGPVVNEYVGVMEFLNGCRYCGDQSIGLGWEQMEKHVAKCPEVKGWKKQMERSKKEERKENGE